MQIIWKSNFFDWLYSRIIMRYLFEFMLPHFLHTMMGNTWRGRHNRLLPLLKVLSIGHFEVMVSLQWLHTLKATYRAVNPSERGRTYKKKTWIIKCLNLCKSFGSNFFSNKNRNIMWLIERERCVFVSKVIFNCIW